MIRFSLILCLGVLFVAGCGDSQTPVEGDNPASASARKATPEEVSARGGINQTRNPPGTGRSGAGGDLGATLGNQ